jgi:PHS family inorganic phosphate transporter-like MFS transporter
VHYVALGAAFLGAMVGMMVMGYLGDLMGRHRALVVTTGIQMLGALGCALLTFDIWGGGLAHGQTIYAAFCGGRVLLGVGVGGMYPLSASHAAEHALDSQRATATRVGRAFFWQSPGTMAPYALALLLLAAGGAAQCSSATTAAACRPPPSGPPGGGGGCAWDAAAAACRFGVHSPTWLPSLQFRLVVGLGALPAAVVMLSAAAEARRPGVAAGAAAAAGRRAPLAEIAAHPEHWRTLAGTAGAWFVYDISYYGVNAFLPDIARGIFGRGETQPGARLSLTADIHLNALNSSYGRMHL